MKPSQLLIAMLIAGGVLFGLLTALVFMGMAPATVLVDDIQRGLMALGGALAAFHLTKPNPPKGDDQ